MQPRLWLTMVILAKFWIWADKQNVQNRKIELSQNFLHPVKSIPKVFSSTVRALEIANLFISTVILQITKTLKLPNQCWIFRWKLTINWKIHRAPIDQMTHFIYFILSPIELKNAQLLRLSIFSYNGSSAENLYLKTHKMPVLLISTNCAIQ